jgi:hypothetical protein
LVIRVIRIIKIKTSLHLAQERQRNKESTSKQSTSESEGVEPRKIAEIAKVKSKRRKKVRK